jgi:hypothetical protein
MTSPGLILPEKLTFLVSRVYRPDVGIAIILEETPAILRLISVAVLCAV